MYADAETARQSQADYWHGYQRLTGKEIKKVFADVIDHAKIIDGAGGLAINRWFVDGRFSSAWQVSGNSGQLSGKWWVENNLRCIAVDISIADLTANQAQCGPIYSKAGNYYSVNKLGRIHGIHALSAMTSAP